MATGRRTKLTGAVGEFLVAAELCRRDLLATPFAGNVPHYDIIASGQNGGHIVVQVKAINGMTWQFDIRHFMTVELRRNRQIPGAVKPEPYPDLHVVLVALRGDGREFDRFFVMSWLQLRDLLVLGYKANLKRHGGIRPRSPESFHTALAVREAEPFENRWETLLDSLDGQ